MNCIRTFTPANSSTICALQFIGCDWAQILLLCPKTDMHCALLLVVLGGSALTIVAIGGSKPATRFGVLAEGISVFIRRTLFASRSMFPSDNCLLGRNSHLMNHWGFDSEGLWLWGNHFGWRSPWWREACHALFSGVSWHLSYTWGKLEQTLVIVPV